MRDMKVWNCGIAECGKSKTESKPADITVEEIYQLKVATQTVC